MRTYQEQLSEVKEIIKRSPTLDIIECKEVIAEDGRRVLVRSVEAMKFGDSWDSTITHEIWDDKEMYQKNMPYDRARGLQCRMGITGGNEADLIAQFYQASSIHL